MKSEINKLFAEEIQEESPGAVVAVVNEGEVVHCQGYGLANVEWSIPIEPDTVFRLASITKQFTSTAIMMLEEAGKLGVDDPLTKFLPDYPTSGHDIRIHHLLNHTSGIKSYTSIDGWFPYKIVHDMTPQEIRDEFCQIPFDFKPGKRFLYNNSGYHLLGMIIEQVSGIEYERFVQQKIFDPLGMKRSYYMHNAAIIPRRANGYGRDEGGFKNADYLSMTHPYAAGSLGATVEDMTLWAKAVYENSLISQETQERMWAPTVLENGSTESYGFGWGLGDYRGHPFVHHSGGVNGFSTFMAQFRDDPLAIIVLANREGFDSGLYTMKLARLALGLPAIIRNPIEISAEAQASVVGKYMVDEQWPLEIVQEDGALFLKTDQQEKLFPLSETAFYTYADPETEIRFSNEQDGKYQHLSRVSSLHSFTAVRHEE